jgi:hypothetical protein
MIACDVGSEGGIMLKRIAKGVLWGVAILLVVIVAGGYLLPDKAVVKRQTVIATPPEKVFAVIADLARAKDWQPWPRMDPDIKITIEGEPHSVGQKMSWESAMLGNGSQVITSLDDGRRIGVDLDFGEMGKSSASFELVAVGGGTGVAWGLESPLDGILMRWMGLMFDRMIGADFEKGLADLKGLVEKEAAGG